MKLFQVELGQTKEGRTYWCASLWLLLEALAGIVTLQVHLYTSSALNAYGEMCTAVYAPLTMSFSIALKLCECLMWRKRSLCSTLRISSGNQQPPWKLHEGMEPPSTKDRIKLVIHMVEQYIEVC